jgi:hypothetical protein
MSRTRHITSAVVAIAAIAAITAAVATAAGSRAAKGRRTSGTAYFSITHMVGSTQFFAGNNTDKLLGQTGVTYTAKILSSNVTGVVTVKVTTLTLWTKTGSLSGTATAKENVATGAITDGQFSLTKGTGAQKGHSLAGTFSGSGSTAKNQYQYTYKAVYK